jgi:hypothetical protein
MWQSGAEIARQSIAICLLVEVKSRETLSLMADDPTKRGAGDRARINVHEAHEVRYWTKQLGVTEEELKAAVAKAGVMAEAVRRELGK